MSDKNINEMPKKNPLSAQIDLSKFEKATDDEKKQQDVMSESTTFFRDAMKKLFRNPLAVVSIIVLFAILVIIIVAPMIVPYGYEEMLSVNGKRDKGAKNLAPFEYSEAEQKYIAQGGERFPHIFGTDEQCRDYFIRVVYGTRVSLIVGFFASIIVLIIGMLYGMGNGDPMSKEAWDFIDEYLVNLDGKIASSSSQVYNGVANGEYAVGLSYEDPCVELEAAGEQPVKVVYAAEGTVYPGESVQIIKGAPHADAAKQFVDYVLSEECQTAVCAELNLRPCRAGIAVNAKMTPDEAIKMFDTYSTAYVAENKAAIVATYLDHVEMTLE